MTQPKKKIKLKLLLILIILSTLLIIGGIDLYFLLKHKNNSSHASEPSESLASDVVTDQPINGQVKLITLTNSGYIDYTLNCLKSLELVGFENPLHCYVLGNEGHNILQSRGYKSILLKSHNDADTKFNQFREGNWHNVTKRKFEIIYNELMKNEFVCFTDGDIVFLDKNFLNYCFNYIQDKDMVIQNDTLSNTDHTNLCSGFMLIKSNKKTLELFNPTNVEKDVKSGWDDQIYINKIKSKLNYKLLPLELFPNGNYYYKNHQKLKPMLVHFNWVKGHIKKENMLKYKKWYLQ